MHHGCKRQSTVKSCRKVNLAIFKLRACRTSLPNWDKEMPVLWCASKSYPDRQRSLSDSINAFRSTTQPRCLLVCRAVHLTAHYFDSDIEVRQSLPPVTLVFCLSLLLHLALNLITPCILMPDKSMIRKSRPSCVLFMFYISSLALAETPQDPRCDRAFLPSL